MSFLRSTLVGLGLSLGVALTSQAASDPSAIRDRFESIEQVEKALREKGLETSDLIIGVDLTKSNTWTGEGCFDDKCLHALIPNKKNPYQEVINVVGRTLNGFDDDNIIPMFGFGDTRTKSTKVFPMAYGQNGQWCEGFKQVEEVYTKFAGTINKKGGIRLSGGTSFVPIIEKAIEIIEANGGYHILVIISDGSVDDYEANHQALVKASNYPLSVIMVGVGNGDTDNFEKMEKLDDDMRGKTFDNFQFVNFTELWEATADMETEERQAEFAVEALMEVPDQYSAIKEKGILDRHLPK